MRNLAAWCVRHRWWTVAGWIVALVLLVGIHGSAGSAYTDNFKLPHTGSFDAIRLLQRSTPRASGETDQLVIATSKGRVTDPQVRARAEALFAKVQALPDVAAVGSPYTPSGAKQIAKDGTVAFATVTFTNAANQNKITAAQARKIVSTITSASGNGVEFEAEGNIAQAGNTQNTGSGLLFGFIAAAAVLFIVFGSLTAMFLPLITAGLSLGSGISVVGLLSHVINIATFSNELAAHRPRRRRRLRPVHRHPLQAGARPRRDA
jgi:RND superfamily putative drug exporter